ncbi:MAG: hypothetical protein JKY97_00750 [Citromicrobium sp.]|nr:hypothetical protein [Citromicrobium sp.]
MALFDWLTGLFTAPITPEAPPPIGPAEINPATGLPMAGGIGSADVGGNPYGTDLRQQGEHVWSAFDDHAHHPVHDHWNDWSNPAGGYDPSRDW